MKTYKELSRDPAWVAKHNQVKAEINHKREARRAALAKARKRRLGTDNEPGGSELVGDQWKSLVESFRAKGMNAQRAATAAHKAAPELREAYVAIANGRMMPKAVAKPLALLPEISTQANEITLFGTITEDAAWEFKRRLASCDPSQPLTVRIDSDGGYVHPGMSIFDAIEQWPAKTIAVIESNAFSMAACIAAACDERYIKPNGLVMIHKPYSDIDESEMQQTDFLLLDILKDKIAKGLAKILNGGRAAADQLLLQDSWITAENALQMGFVTAIT